MNTKIYKNRKVKYRRVMDWSQRLKNHNSIIIKIFDKKLVGTVKVDKNFISYLVVNPAERGKGYGTILLKEAEKYISKKYEFAELIPQDNDEALRRFYSRRGYTGFSVDAPGYEEEDKTWWVMKKQVNSRPK